jgi:hypothetical protein
MIVHREHSAPSFSGFHRGYHRENESRGLPRNSCHNGTMETSSLDLLYLESDPRTNQPSACISLRTNNGGEYAGVKAERLLSAQCMTFIELDAEIRRLHAELDEIRARAKKKFYRAFSATAGA